MQLSFVNMTQCAGTVFGAREIYFLTKHLKQLKATHKNINKLIYEKSTQGATVSEEVSVIVSDFRVDQQLFSSKVSTWSLHNGTRNFYKVTVPIIRNSLYMDFGTVGMNTLYRDTTQSTQKWNNVGFIWDIHGDKLSSGQMHNTNINSVCTIGEFANTYLGIPIGVSDTEAAILGTGFTIPKGAGSAVSAGSAGGAVFNILELVLTRYETWCETAINKMITLIQKFENSNNTLLVPYPCTSHDAKYYNLYYGGRVKNVASIPSLSLKMI